MLPCKLLQRLGRTQWQLRRGSVLVDKIPEPLSVVADKGRNVRAVLEVDGGGHDGDVVPLGDVGERALLQGQEECPVMLGSGGLELRDDRPACAVHGILEQDKKTIMTDFTHFEPSAEIVF